MTPVPGDTWGISGPGFLALYGVVAVGVVEARRRLDRSTLPAGTRLSPQEIGYLRAGDPLALTATLSALRAEGVLDDEARVVGTPVATADPVAAAVLDVLDTAPDPSHRRVPSLARRAPVAQALRGLRDDLRDRGLLFSRGRQQLLWIWSTLPWVVVAIGAARLFVGVDRGRPVGIVAVEVLVAAWVAVFVSVAMPRGATRAARNTVAGLRASHEHLDPKHRPSWATYGASAAGMSVALFGTGALVLAQPAFADVVQVQQSSAGGHGPVVDGGGGGGCGG